MLESYRASSRQKQRRVRLVTALVLSLAAICAFQLIVMHTSNQSIEQAAEGALGAAGGNKGPLGNRNVANRWADYLKNVVNKAVNINRLNYTEWSELAAPAELKIKTEYRTYTPSELEAAFHGMDLVYTWVNGSEANHMFRKYWRRRDPIYASKPGWDDQRWFPKETIGNVDWFLENMTEIRRFLTERRGGVISSRDRESDELRFSFRSLDQYATWHTGRILVVAPGHTPSWLDHAHNFFAASVNPQNVPGQRPARRRVVCVHQDSVLNGDERLTWNSNTIERSVHKLKHLSALFVQFNDDYFINKNTSAGHFVSAYGGPVMLHEQGEVRGGVKAYQVMRKIWLGGVFHANAFNVNELEVVPPKYLPKYIMDDIERVEEAAAAAAQDAGGTGRKLQAVFNFSELRLASRGGGRMGVLGAKPNAVQEHVIAQMAELQKRRDAAVAQHQGQQGALTAANNNNNNAAGVLASLLTGDRADALADAPAKRKRYFCKHAPFVYCRNMFRHFATRYYRQMRPPAQKNPHRSKEDFLMPFIHHGFALDRPWAGSVNYLPHLRDLNVAGEGVEVPTQTIVLNNEDGCAPALNKIGTAAESLLVIFINDMKENEKRVENLRAVNPVFFALNDGFSVDAVSEQLKAFMLTKYPTASPFERMHTDHADPVLAAREDSVFESLMRLPLVVLVTEEISVCPLVRSLQLALPGFMGPIVFLKARLATPAAVLLNQETISDDGPRLVTRCKLDTTRVFAVPLSEDDSLLPAAEVAARANAALGTPAEPVRLLDGTTRVDRVVMDLRRMEISPLRIPGQTLAWEDFGVVATGGGSAAVGSAVLRNEQINWIAGSTEKHLLHTWPLPYTRYEDANELLFQANPSAG